MSDLIMQAKAFPTELFGFDGRGESLQRWIHDADLLFPEPEVSGAFAAPSGGIVGAQYDGGWVLFHGLQVTQIVSEEVHSYWHLDFIFSDTKKSGVWEIDGSEWIKTFAQRHLAEHKHFIIEFYDEIVEVICRTLIFGADRFDLERVVATDNRLSYAYLRRATIQKKLGNFDEAVDDYQKYIQSLPDSSSAEYAQRCINFIRTGDASGLA